MVERDRMRALKSVVKDCGSTVKLQLILGVVSAAGVGGLRGLAVKCLDIMKTTDREGRFPECN